MQNLPQTKNNNNKKKALPWSKAIKASKKKPDADHLLDRYNDVYTSDITAKNATELRRIPPKTLVKQMQSYSQHMKQRYLVGLIHPDVAVSHHLKPKLYHDVPLPTGAFGLYGSFTANTNIPGNMLISYRPPGLPGTANAMQNITLNNHATLTGLAANTNGIFRTTLPPMDIPVQRYRLVSSLVRVTYQGPLLNLSGKFFTCATYEPFSIKYFGSADQVDPFEAKYADFSIIKNGLWNTSTNVIDGEHSVECLWVPTDGKDYFFERTQCYYGNPFVAPDLLINPGFEGARLCYVIALSGLPASTPVMVEQWANYEIIPEPSGAPYLANASDVIFTAKDKQVYSEVISNTMQSEGLVRPGKEKSEGSWTSVFKSLLTNGIPIITKLLSLF